MSDFLRIFIAAIGFGVGAEAIRRYRDWKQRRRQRSYDERNGGFWTDQHLFEAEFAAASLALAGPVGVSILLISADRPWWVASAILPVYALAIYLLVYGMNAPKR